MCVQYESHLSILDGHTASKSRIFNSEAFHILFKVIIGTFSAPSPKINIEVRQKITEKVTNNWRNRLESILVVEYGYKDTLSRVDLLDSLNSQFSRAYSFWKSASKQAKSSEKQ